MTTGFLRPHAVGFAMASLLASTPAAAEGSPLVWLSREISPAPPHAMRRVSSAGAYLLEMNVTTARAVASSQSFWDVTVGVSTYSVSNAESLSEELAFVGTVGGGTGGLEGQLDARFLVGWRGYVTDWQGPFVRIGAEDRQFGSFLTFVSLPAGRIGYEIIDNGLALDVGLEGAFDASATYGVYSGAPRDVSDSPTFGAFAWLVARPVQVGIRWDRLVPHNDGLLGGTPIDDLGTNGCIGWWRRALFVCANFEVTSGPAALPTTSSLFGTTAFSQTLSVGIGFVGSRAEAPRHAM
jgi:hypothetical protein